MSLPLDQKLRLLCRERMTDVVVQHLITEQETRIQCKDYVKKLAIYKGCLAVQLPKQITIYQLKLGADANDMLYTPVAVIEQELECNLLVVTAQHLTLCQVCPLYVQPHVYTGDDAAVILFTCSYLCPNASCTSGKLQYTFAPPAMPVEAGRKLSYVDT